MRRSTPLVVILCGLMLVACGTDDGPDGADGGEALAGICDTLGVAEDALSDVVDDQELGGSNVIPAEIVDQYRDAGAYLEGAALPDDLSDDERLGFPKLAAALGSLPDQPSLDDLTAAQVKDDPQVAAADSYVRRSCDEDGPPSADVADWCRFFEPGFAVVLSDRSSLQPAPDLGDVRAFGEALPSASPDGMPDDARAHVERMAEGLAALPDDAIVQDVTDAVIVTGTDQGEAERDAFFAYAEESCG